ncbi:MAG: bacteriohemerythrin [Candidatus Sulfotelmatobacter sp.]
MSTAFQWKQSYSVKVMALDNQHKKLFDLINELHHAMSSGHGKDVAGDVLRRLTEYTVSHFRAEEALMEKYNFPGLASHRSEHKALTDKVLAFKKDFDAGTGVVTPQLMTFLQRWITDHIQGVDQRYSDFLNANGVH